MLAPRGDGPPPCAAVPPTVPTAASGDVPSPHAGHAQPAEPAAEVLPASIAGEPAYAAWCWRSTAARAHTCATPDQDHCAPPSPPSGRRPLIQSVNDAPLRHLRPIRMRRPQLRPAPPIHPCAITSLIGAPRITILPRIRPLAVNAIPEPLAVLGNVRLRQMPTVDAVPTNILTLLLLHAHPSHSSPTTPLRPPPGASASAASHHA